jgi:TP901 family phage tail tape measure protein
MARNSHTSQLVMELLDRVSGPARRIAGSLRGVNGVVRDGASMRLPIADRVDAAIMRNSAALDSARMGIVDAVGAYYLLSGAITAPVRAATAFESAMADVKKVVDFPTPQAFMDFRTELLALSKQVPYSVNDLATIAAAAGQAGIAGADLVRFTDAAAKIGTAFDISADDAGDAMAKMMTGLGMSIDEVIQLSDAMNHLSNAQASSAAEILDVVRRVGAQGKMFGFSAEETAAFASAMISAGAQSDVAATSFNNMGRALTRGGSATKRQIKAFSALGLEAGDVARRMQEDAVGTTVDVMERLAALPAETRAAMATDLFGDEARALGPLLTNLGLVRDSLGLIGDESKYAGSAFKEFAARNATFGNKMQRFRNVTSALSITIGSALIPVLSDLIDRIAPVIERMATFIEAHPQLVANVMASVAALIAMRGAISAIRFAGLLSIGAGLQSVGRGGAYLATAARNSIALQAALGAMSGAPLTTLARISTGMRGMIFAVPGISLIASGISAIGAALATISAPVWAGVAAVVAVIAAAGYTIYKYWDRLSAVFSGVAARLGEELAPALDLIRPAIDWLSGIGDAIAMGWGRAKDAVGSFFEWLGSFFGREVLTEDQKAAAERSGYEFADRLINGIKAIPQRVKAYAVEMAAAGRELIQKLWEGMKARFDEFMVWVAEIPQRIIEAIGRIDLSNVIKFPTLPSWMQSNVTPAANPAGEFEGYDGMRARGGPVSPGRRFLVGENGPEVFEPTGGGYIHPNGSRGLGGVSIGQISINPQMSFPGASAADAEAIAGRVLDRIKTELGAAMSGVMADAWQGD